MLNNIHPYRYLVDALQRIEPHPQSAIHELTPQQWATLFANNPIPRLVDRAIEQRKKREAQY